MTDSRTLADLADSYLTDARSPFHTKSRRTRANYESNIRYILADAGSVRLADLNTESIRTLYDKWTANNKMAMAHKKLCVLRVLLTFGEEVLKDQDCYNVQFAIFQMRVSSKTKMPTR